MSLSAVRDVENCFPLTFPGLVQYQQHLMIKNARPESEAASEVVTTVEKTAFCDVGVRRSQIVSLHFEVETRCVFR